MTVETPVFLSLTPGSIVSYCNEQYLITSLLDIDNVLAKHRATGQIQRIRIAELQAGNLGTANTETTIAPASTIPDEEWSEAMKRFEIIVPLLKGKNRNRSIVEERAKQFNMSPATIYRWISTYTSTGVISSFVRKPRVDKGQSRISPKQEEIIQTCLRETFLHSQRYSIPTVIEQIAIHCREVGIAPPHPNTIRNRISIISEEEVLKRRHSKKEATQSFSPIEGSFPGADFPLSVVQVDHTPLDIIVVDEVNRLPIGRPWITLAIDVYSRMVCGFYISMDHPSTMSVALCLAHAILPKENWLINRNIDISWPVWGTPDTLHVDNAREFRGNALKRACEEYNVTLTWRPVATPNYGGHIERYLGNLLHHIHEISGTTFSNPTERGEYDSDKKSIVTLKELEKWIAVHILGQYHQRRHSQLGMSPIKKFELGILGDKNNIGRGLPPRIRDENRLLLDFMPMFERTIQDYGVVFEGIHYYSNVLRRWINAKDVDNPKLKRKFIFRYDPRDISKLFFLDPELNMYYPISYRTTSRPAISIWELREATRKARESFGNEINENLIFSSYKELRDIERMAAKKTKAIRRAAQSKRDTESRKDYLPVVPAIPTASKFNDTIVNNVLPTVIAFEDIDEDIEP